VGRIHVLADAMINRIAAGEVVERPASVVKELLENSIDAGATTIEVACERGGRQALRVADNGTGMDRDDALLAIERHATSKLSSAEELEAIATLGFRGEALASIAAVSRFVLASAAEDGRGTEVEVHGGRIRAVREIARARGTEIRVERLFVNMPARRKFLRSEATELAHVAKCVTRLALAHANVRFTLDHDGHRMLQANPSERLVERVAQIHGPDFARKLLPFELARDGMRVFGLAGRPTDGQPRRDGQHVFVNRRPVQDRVLAHAVHEAYGNTMPRGRHPWLFLLLDCPPALVDVNVHPQKSEVRYREPSRINDLARDALVGVLSAAAGVPGLGDLRPAPRPGPPEGVERALAAYFEHATAAPRAPERTAAVAEWTVRAAAPATRLSEPLPLPPDEHGAGSTREVVALAQYRDSYIVAQDEEGLILVDQHAAHERVLFERYLADAAADRVEIQRLLFPIALDLPPAELVVVTDEAAELRRLGFLVEPFGPSAVRVDGVPAVAAEVDPEALVREVLGQASRIRSAAADASTLRHKLVTSAACQAAIKIHHPLDRASMARLLADLFRTANPTTCPHGRPLIFRLPHGDIERAFRRR
jgi:DNA mismatch repair protein MutL